ncbi:MAG: diaminopimelate decarboxylase [Elainellaceae cyanobacterium]
MPGLTTTLAPVNQPSAALLSQAATEFGTPLYLYDLALIESRFALLNDSLPENFRLHYALKANSNLTLSHLLARRGAAAEASSLGEFIAALKSGYRAEETVFTGPGKTANELAQALDQHIGLIVVESANEARRVNQLAAERGKQQPVLLRINPQFRTLNSCDAGCAIDSKLNGAANAQANLETNSIANAVENSDALKPIAMNGQGASKFGVDEALAADEMVQIQSLSHIRLQGIHVFTESNVLDYRQLIDAWTNTVAIAHRLRSQGFDINIIDFGGGIGVPYNSVDAAFDVPAFGAALQALFSHEPFHFILEMGRYLVCEAGMYLTDVLDIKESQGKRFAILNGGVHHLYRTPAMQNASKFLRVLGKESSDTLPTTIAGQLPTPIDVVVRDAPLPVDLQIGDRLLIRNCGAYGFNHSLTNFALHPAPAEVAILGDRLELIRARSSYDDFFQHQRLVQC